MAHAPRPPAAMVVASAMPDTNTGVVRIEVVPSPTWPNLFWPQHMTVPSLMSAQPPPLAVRPVAPATFDTCCAKERKLPLEPVTCPRLSSPQHATLPALESAHAALWPITTCTAPLTPMTWVGTEICLSPTWPSLPT